MNNNPPPIQRDECKQQHECDIYDDIPAFTWAITLGSIVAGTVVNNVPVPTPTRTPTNTAATVVEPVSANIITG